MSGHAFANTAQHSPPPRRAESQQLTKIVRGLVGHTVEEVERELILSSLSHYCGSRTCAARILGISIRTMRNKINQYAALGMEVPAPGQREETPVVQTH
jgi:two-component system, response regulator FlrC